MTRVYYNSNSHFINLFPHTNCYLLGRHTGQCNISEFTVSRQVTYSFFTLRGRKDGRIKEEEISRIIINRREIRLPITGANY